MPLKWEQIANRKQRKGVVDTIHVAAGRTVALRFCLCLHWGHHSSRSSDPIHVSALRLTVQQFGNHSSTQSAFLALLRVKRPPNNVQQYAFGSRLRVSPDHPFVGQLGSTRISARWSVRISADHHVVAVHVTAIYLQMLRNKSSFYILRLSISVRLDKCS